MTDYSDDLAKTILAPKSLVVVTGAMGSGMTDFSMRLLQHFEGHIFGTERLLNAPPNYRPTGFLSLAMSGVATEEQSRLPFAVYIDHAGVNFYTSSRREATRQQWCFEWLTNAIKKAEGTLILSGHGLSDASNLPTHLFEGWSRVTLCVKERRGDVFIGDFNGEGTRYRHVPPTSWRYDTQDFSSFVMDINPKRFAQFFTDLKEEMDGA
jgi:hypothetical protein